MHLHARHSYLVHAPCSSDARKRHARVLRAPFRILVSATILEAHQHFLCHSTNEKALWACSINGSHALLYKSFTPQQGSHKKPSCLRLQRLQQDFAVILLQNQWSTGIKKCWGCLFHEIVVEIEYNGLISCWGPSCVVLPKTLSSKSYIGEIKASLDKKQRSSDF